MVREKNRSAVAFVAGFLASLLVQSAALAQSWSAAASMPTARAAFAADAIGDTVYVVGGGVLPAVTPSAGLEALDTLTGVWSVKAPMSNPRIAPTAVAAGGKLYVMGGHNGSTPYDVVEAYDPATDTWSVKAPMPSARVGHSAALLNGKIYVMGGVDFFFNPVMAVDVYDPLTDSWSSAKPIPEARVIAGAAGLDGLLYYAGGFSFLHGNDPGIAVYDPVTDNWTARSALFAAPRAQAAVKAFNGALYFVGGAPSGPGAFAEVYKYDAAADAWLAAPSLATARYAHDAAVAGGALYAMGGFSASGLFLSSTERLSLPTDTVAPQTAAALSPAPNAAGWNNSDVTVKLTATDETGGSGVKSITYRFGSGPSVTVNGDFAQFTVSAQGTSTIKFFATDNAGNVEAEKTRSVKIDKSAPAGTLTLAPNILWPPNHRMVTIAPTLSASEPVTISGITVSSNEAQSAGGDWVVSNGTLQLRATRAGKGSGRVYTVTYTVTDIAGNATNVSATVTVPHDQGR